MAKSQLEDDFQPIGASFKTKNASVAWKHQFQNPGLQYEFYIEARNQSGAMLNHSKTIQCNIS